MKNSSTSTALMAAITSATTVFAACPMGTVERNTVKAIRPIKAIQTTRYVFIGDTCSDISSPLSGVLVRDQVQQWEEEDPHQVNKVPVQPADVDRVVVLRVISSYPGPISDEGQQHDSDGHV